MYGIATAGGGDGGAYGANGTNATLNTGGGGGGGGLRGAGGAGGAGGSGIVIVWYVVDGGSNAPAIAVQPTNATVTAGQSAQFSVTATGTTPLYYQWYTNSGVIGGATASSYSTPATTTADSGKAFTVTVTNAHGAVTSSVATLTVNPIPTYTVSYHTNGATSGTAPSAQIKTNGIALTLASNGGNLAKPGYTFSGWNTDDDGSGMSYAEGASYTTESSVTLYAKWTVNTPPSITVQPMNATVTAGQSAQFSVTATGTTPLYYQWYTNNGVIGGATSASYTTPATTTNDSGKEFRVTVTNAYGAVTSDVAILTVTPFVGVLATGGTATNYTLNGTNFTAHIFSAVGADSLHVSAGGNVEVLVVGGGGGGGGGDNGNDGAGGGGGAGGLIYANMTLVASNYNVTVGMGGAGTNANGKATKGTNSVFGPLVALGGGGVRRLTGDPADADDGGSGGGAFGRTNIATVGTGLQPGSVSGGFGNNGGNYGGGGSGSNAGGGGGGAGSAGASGSGASGGNGGGGFTTSISGVSKSYAGGGGGGANNGGTAGTATAGGGTGGSGIAGGANATANTGGGGGGAGASANAAPGGNGGSGIVIVRYVTGGGVDPFQAWRQLHFTATQLTNMTISGDAADPDHDGLNNQQEYGAGTDPTNALSCLTLYATTNNIAADGKFVVRWQSVSNKFYAVQATTNLLTGFSSLTNGLPATPTVNVYTDTVNGAGQKFYRVGVSPVE
jgi:uncharacterized repeat protein (TIGR02543 family)